MDRVLRPSKFDTEPDEATAAKQWTHWFKTFTNFLATLPTENLDKLAVLTNYIAPNVYEFISEVPSFEIAVKTLKDIYVKPKSEIFARHLLQTRKQETSETLDLYLQALKILAQDCNFTDVSANQYREESILDSFINGLHSNYIRQRLLEVRALDLKSTYDQARSLEMAQK